MFTLEALALGLLVAVLGGCVTALGSIALGMMPPLSLVAGCAVGAFAAGVGLVIATD